MKEVIIVAIVVLVISLIVSSYFILSGSSPSPSPSPGPSPGPSPSPSPSPSPGPSPSPSPEPEGEDDEDGETPAIFQPAWFDINKMGNIDSDKLTELSVFADIGEIRSEEDCVNHFRQQTSTPGGLITYGAGTYCALDKPELLSDPNFVISDRKNNDDFQPFNIACVDPTENPFNKCGVSEVSQAPEAPMRVLEFPDDTSDLFTYPSEGQYTHKECINAFPDSGNGVIITDPNDDSTCAFVPMDRVGGTNGIIIGEITDEAGNLRVTCIDGTQDCIP